MQMLLKIFIDLCLMRIGPQDLPGSLALRNLSIALYFSMGILLSLVAKQPFGEAIVTALLDTLLLTLFAGLSLQLLNKRERINQTITALTGSGVVLSLVSLPLVMVFYASGGNPNDLISLLVLLITMWNIMIIGHIIRHAFNLPLLAGVVIAITYIALSMQLIGYLLNKTNG